MLVLRESLLETPIMSLQTGVMIAHTVREIIDPRKLTLVAFFCHGPGLSLESILHTSDIRETGQMGFIVDGAESIMPPDDLVRLQEIINFKFELIGKEVADDHGTKLGKVANYATDTDSFYIIKLHVRPGLLRSLQTAELIIDRRQIREINEKRIVVKSATIADEQPHHAIVGNPFRRSHPQPDIAQRREN